MRTYSYSKLSEEKISSLCRRPKMDFKFVFSEVQPIIDDVRSKGDEAVLHYTQKFDGLRPEPQVVHPEDKHVNLEAEAQQAIDTAMENIRAFHKEQLPSPLKKETMAGVVCKRVWRPIERVGLYIPGGSAPLVSTLMMLGVPAALVGCDQIIIATPPDEHGEIADALIYIAQQIGADMILKAGGAQAVAAMAWGTETAPKVDKILGPGNQYVTAAKMMLQNSEAQIAIDMPAGPSEVLVIADETANPAFVAADLLSQAEHGPDSQAVLVATPNFDRQECLRQLEKQLQALPRKKIAEEAFNHSFFLRVEKMDRAIQFSNRYAPEHLIIQCKNAGQWQDKIRNAGSVFLGAWSTESVGDYASGTNHTLPTYGYARMYSGVSVHSFLKSITMQTLTKKGLQNIGPTVEKLADLETLEGHKRAVSIRLEQWRNDE